MRIKCEWPVDCDNSAEYSLLYEADYSALVEGKYCFHHAYLTSQRYPVLVEEKIDENQQQQPSDVSQMRG